VVGAVSLGGATFAYRVITDVMTTAYVTVTLRFVSATKTAQAPPHAASGAARIIEEDSINVIATSAA